MSPMPVIENSNHEEEIIPVFVLFVPVPVLLSSVFLCLFLVGKVWMKIRRRKQLDLKRFIKTVNIKDKCKDAKTRKYHTDTLLMIIALIHTMYESELRFSSFEKR